MQIKSSIDLRSDLVTKPTQEMIDAMAEAAVDDQGFGLRENKYVQSLEKIAAEELGKDDAIFCPSVTMCNQIAINAATTAGDIIIADRNCHVSVTELGAPAALSGVTVEPYDTGDGISIERSIRNLANKLRDSNASQIKMLLLENTHTRNGGTVLTVGDTQAITEEFRNRKIWVHLDGARLFNAATALEATVSELASSADSVAISLNKCLSAPVGAILAGSRDFILKADKIRQRFGGGWRPAGVVAAAGIIALNTMQNTIKYDHEKAKRLAGLVNSLDGISVSQKSVQTNIVVISTDGLSVDSHEVIRKLGERGVLALAFSPSTIRFVFHKDITDESVPVIYDHLKKVVLDVENKNERNRKYVI
jgi:threonine aldolase